MKHFFSFIAMALFINIAGLAGQNSVVVSSGNAVGTTGSAPFSIGLTAYATGNGTTGSVTQGVQQFTYTVSITTGIEFSQINLKCFPNPVQDYLILNIEDTLKDLSYKLIDTNGRLLTSDKITEKSTSLPMNNIEKGVYFVKIIQDKKEIKVFKIIKK